LLEQDEFTISSVPRSYQVTWDITENPCDSINKILSLNSKNVLLIDEKIHQLYGKDIQHDANNIFKAPATEVFKSLEGVLPVYDFLYQRDFTKGETLVVVGGGTIQDVGGFVGASYKRGIHWIHFPTTLLAMSDSCIGGKSGINYHGAKNQLALLSPAHAVVINPMFLNTLEKKEIQSGLGEILKICIMGGPELLMQYSQCVKRGEIVKIEDAKRLISGALAVKKAVIEKDEFECHLRKALNYGHTLGHAIESMSNYDIPHGVAVVVGMMLVNDMSCERGYLSKEHCTEINALCWQLLDDNVLNILKKIDTNNVLQSLKQDKKVMGDCVTFVMFTK